MAELKLKDIQRFFKHIKIVGSCWEWQLYKNKYGYGVFGTKTKNLLAHRFSYMIFVRELDPKLTIDHLCRNHSCVNPLHLEEVSQKENLQRSSICITTMKKNQTYCIHGHSLSDKNLYVRPDKRRECRICRRKADRLHYAKIKLRRN